MASAAVKATFAEDDVAAVCEAVAEIEAADASELAEAALDRGCVLAGKGGCGTCGGIGF